MKTICLDTLVKAGANVNTPGDNGITPLFLAAQAGHNRCLEKLLYSAADMNAKTDNGFTPLMQALLAGHAQCVDTLITAGADVNTAVTLKPCHDDIMKMREAAMARVSSYLVAGDVIANLNQKVENTFADLKTDEIQFTCLGLAVVADMEKCVPSLLEGGANMNVPVDVKSALVCAADRGQTKVLNYLIRSGADVNYHDSRGMTAFYAAAKNGHTDCVKRLVESGADVNKQDRDGYTPLMAAAENGYDNCVIQMVEVGADVNITDDTGNTALMWASMADQWKCVSALLGEGADVNKANNYGDVSLMCAARKGDDEWLSKLVKVGADVNVINKLGETAFTIAHSKHHEQCMTILTTEGVDVNIPDFHTLKLADEDKTKKEMVGAAEEELDAKEFRCRNLDRGCDLSIDTATPPATDPGMMPTNGEIPQTENSD